MEPRPAGAVSRIFNTLRLGEFAGLGMMPSEISTSLAVSRDRIELTA